MSRISRKKRQQHLKNKNLLGGTVIVVAMVVLIYFIVRPGDSPELDDDYCPEDQSYAAQIAILLDPSDTLNAVQNRSVMSRLVGMIEETAPTNTEIKVYSVGRAGRDVMSNDFRVCKPVHRDSVSWLWGNPNLVEKRYEERFREPLYSVLSAQLDAPSDTISPIIKAIQAAIVDAMQPRNAQLPRQLFIVSDMIQNSDRFSFYRDRGGFSWLMQQPYYATLRVDKAGVEVVIFHLARSGEAGRIKRESSFREFWEDYLRDQGSRRVEWVSVEG